MVPLGAVAEVRDSAGPVQITRYNMFPAAAINGASLPGVSTGDVLATMERLADRDLPRNMNYEWSELSYLQKTSARIEAFRDLQQNPLSAFVLGSVLVFFVLAGLYESWSLPLAVILVVPMCVLCAITGVAVRGQDNNLFTQIGFVVLVGLACKNAILIVDFARERQERGRRPVRRRPRGRRGAAAADRDDVDVLHPHGSSVLRHGRRRRDAPRRGHRRCCGAFRGDAVRPVPDAGILLRRPRPLPRSASGPRAGDGRDRWGRPDTPGGDTRRRGFLERDVRSRRRSRGKSIPWSCGGWTGWGEQSRDLPASSRT